MDLQWHETPRVGDEIIPGPGQAWQKLDYRLYLAIRIGKEKEGETWFAWNAQDGTLCTVFVGHSWVLKRLCKDKQ